MNKIAEPLSLHLFIDEELRKWELSVTRIELASAKNSDERMILVTLDKPMHLSSLRIIEQSLGERVRAYAVARHVRCFWSYQPRAFRSIDIDDATGAESGPLTLTA